MYKLATLVLIEDLMGSLTLLQGLRSMYKLYLE